MHVERYGRGRQVYFGLHGWNGSHETFLPVVDMLPDNVCFWSADLPGCGGSAVPAAWSLDSIAGEIARELKEPTVLVGNCSGAILALLVAQKAPGRVSRVVAIDAFAWWPWYFRIFLSRSIGRYAYFSTFANPLGRWLTNGALRGKRKADTDLTRGFAGADHEVTYRYMTMLGEVGAAERFADLTMPIDIVYGARSFSAVRDSARMWGQVWPHARTFELEGAGHLPIVEAASQVKEILFGGELCSTQQAVHSKNCAV